MKTTKFVRLLPVLLLPTTIGANPTGGVVTSGSATINPATGRILTIDQTSQNAVINWNSFSIGAGETTKFVQPNAASAVLNRVTGGGTSVINGTLTANGQVYLINGNGIYIGGSGMVNTAGFTASTLDITDANFLSANLHFAGNSTASVQNLGRISATNGNIYFIAQTVSNSGSVSAPKGTVGLAAAQDVVVVQKNADGSTVTVNPTGNGSTGSVGGTGVSNTGKISAAMAELRAANGNIYALAINNTGSVRATGVKKQGGKVWLVAEGNGNVKTSGSISTTAGGYIETSGEHVGASGVVAAGHGGMWNIDPTDTTISSAADSNFNINAKTLAAGLSGGGSAAIVVSASANSSGNIVVAAPLAWSSTATLTLGAANDIDINAAITAAKGGLDIAAGNLINAQANVSLGTFTLDSGIWSQIAGTPGLAKLPTFSATDFQLGSGATFARFAGGNGGGSPYQIVDVYGLQGVGSGSGSMAHFNYILNSAINASVTKTWNGGAGFVPIALNAGTFNGNHLTISGLNLTNPQGATNGLFLENDGLVENVNLTGGVVTGASNLALLVGDNESSVIGCSAAGIVNVLSNPLQIQIGGLVGLNQGYISNSSANVTINVSSPGGGASTEDIGGLTGFNGIGASILNCSSSGTINMTGTVGIFYGQVGGLVGLLEGTASNSTSKTVLNVTAAGTSLIGGFAGMSNGGIISNCANSGALNLTAGVVNAGGLVGKITSGGTVSFSHNTGAITAGSANGIVDVGGLVGQCSTSGIITNSGNSGAITILGNNNVAGIGGLIGIAADSSGAITNCTNSGAVKLAQRGQFVGGLIGQLLTPSDLTGCTNTGAITGTGGTATTNYSDIGGLVGFLSGSGLVLQDSSTGAITLPSGALRAGGLIGNFSSTGFLSQSFANCAITLGADSRDVGGLIGSASNATVVTTSTSAGSIVISGNSDLRSIIEVAGLIGSSGGTVTGTSSTVKVTITDIGKVQDLSFTSIGGIAGIQSGTLINNNFSGSIKITGAEVDNVGGVSGKIMNGTILQCGNSGSITVSGLDADNIGGVVGTTSSMLASTNLFNSGAVTVSSTTSSRIGGLIGALLNSFFSDSINTGAVKATGTSLQVGGAIGVNLSGTDVNTIANTGAVTGSSKSGGQYGGLVGNNQGSIVNGYNTGTVTGAGSDIGGLVGFNSGTISLAYNTGSVTAQGAGNTGVGGLIGTMDITSISFINLSYSTGKVSGKGTGIGGLVGSDIGTAGKVSSSYWNQQSSGQTTSADGIAVATTALMNTQSTYVGWNFTSDWGMPLNGTPYLLVYQQPLH